MSPHERTSPRERSSLARHRLGLESASKPGIAARGPHSPGSIDKRVRVELYVTFASHRHATLERNKTSKFLGPRRPLVLTHN